jgi:hypothetical protein
MKHGPDRGDRDGLRLETACDKPDSGTELAQGLVANRARDRAAFGGGARHGGREIRIHPIALAVFERVASPHHLGESVEMGNAEMRENAVTKPAIRGLQAFGQQPVGRVEGDEPRCGPRIRQRPRTME